jgi:hypothetical protein
MNVTYRRRNGSEKWHFCQNCSTWPKSDYLQLETVENSLSAALCLECITKRHFAECSFCLLPPPTDGG